MNPFSDLPVLYWLWQAEYATMPTTAIEHRAAHLAYSRWLTTVGKSWRDYRTPVIRNPVKMFFDDALSGRI